MSSFEWDELSPRPSSRLKYSLAIDAVLMLLGGSTIWLATQYLDFNDPRPLHNAWTYLVAIPLGLVLVDLIFRTIVSRFVERALQVAFLLSMLVHLLLSLGAIHTQLFARGEVDIAQSLTLAAAKQEQKSSVPEYMHTEEHPSPEKPDYLRPVETGTKEASSVETDKQNVEHPSNAPALAKVSDTKPEMPHANLKKAESAIDEPQIKSNAVRIERPELSPEIAEVVKTVELPESAIEAVEESLPSEVAPSVVDAKKRTDAPSAAKLATDALIPNPLAALDRGRNLSKSPQLQERKAFELPALEDRKTELARRDLSDKSAARVPELTESRVPLFDLPKSITGDVANQLPSATVGQPSDIGDRSMSEGARRKTQSIGGSVSRAALEGIAESGSLSKSSGTAGVRSTAPAIQRRAVNMDEVSISQGEGRPRGKKASAVSSGSLTNPLVKLPQAGTGRGGAVTEAKPDDGIASPMVEAPKRLATQGSKLDKGETLRGWDLGIDGLQPSVDLSRSSARSLAASSGRRSNALDIAPSIDSMGLPGPKRLPRLPSAAPTPNAPAVPIPAPAFQQRMTRNEGSSDAAELGQLGPATEAAIERGLEFLAKHQRADGSWRLEDLGDNPRLRSDTAATALSLLAFQGAGYSHRQYHYAPVCKSALEFLLAHQQPNGDLYIPMDEASNANARFYSHSIASLALCEAFGMTQDEALREPAQRAVQFMVKTQDPVGGGWRYQAGIDSDTSVSGWFMMALKSAELSGLEVPKSTFDGITRWLDRAQASPEERHLYRYNPLAADTPTTRHGRVPNPTMTGVGLLMRLYLGWRRNTPEMIQGADYLLGNLPTEGTATQPRRDTYYWYYATQVMFHMGGDRWKQWNGALYPMLITSQVLEGEQFGSWNPAGPIPDRWGPFAGRLYVTTLNLLSLEVYYRHLPIYEDTAR